MGFLGRLFGRDPERKKTENHKKELVERKEALRSEEIKLNLALRDLDRFVRPGGRVVVLSYHSLEDREVKRSLGRRVQEGLYRWHFKGALRPRPEEVRANPRSRSARLRAVVRTG